MVKKKKKITKLTLGIIISSKDLDINLSKLTKTLSF